MKFAGLLETIGKDFAKGLGWAVQYAVPVEKLVGLLFPAVAPETAAVVGATTLVQNAVLLVEQKFAASGAQSGTGVQKLTEVMLLSAPAVTSLLKQAGIQADAPFVQSVVSAVVAVLNVQSLGSAAPVKAAA